VNEVYAEERIY